MARTLFLFQFLDGLNATQLRVSAFRIVYCLVEGIEVELVDKANVGIETDDEGQLLQRLHSPRKTHRQFVRNVLRAPNDCFRRHGAFGPPDELYTSISESGEE